MNYQDQWGRWHDKPVTPENSIPSNNAFIYSAYARKLGLPVETTPYCLAICSSNLTRHPFSNTVPMSRDELLGMSYLGARVPRSWKMDLNFPKFNLFKFLAQLVLLVQNRKDRNFWWRNNLDQMKFLTMKIPLQDRAFYFRQNGVKVPMIYGLIEWIDRKLKPGSNSGALIRFLKYNQAPDVKVWEEYFGENHPFTVKVKEH